MVTHSHLEKSTKYLLLVKMHTGYWDYHNETKKENQVYSTNYSLFLFKEMPLQQNKKITICLSVHLFPSSTSSLC